MVPPSFGLPTSTSAVVLPHSCSALAVVLVLPPSCSTLAVPPSCSARPCRFGWDGSVGLHGWIPPYIQHAYIPYYRISRTPYLLITHTLVWHTIVWDMRSVRYMEEPTVAACDPNRTCHPPRWSALLSSKVNLPHTIDIRTLCDVNLVTQHPKFLEDKSVVLHRVAW